MPKRKKMVGEEEVEEEVTEGTAAEELKAIAAGMTTLVTPSHGQPESYTHAEKLAAWAKRLQEIAEEL